MASSFDDELKRMMEGEQQREQRAAGSAEQFEAIIHELDAVGAPRIWDPNPDIRERNVLDAVVAYRLETDANNDEAILVTYAAMGREIFAIAAIAMAGAASAEDMSKPEQDTESKKKLLARLMIDNYSQEWLDAADGYVPGDSLDLSKETDLRIYIDAAGEKLEPRHAADIGYLNDILLEGSEGMDEGRRIRAVLATTRATMLLIAAKSNPTARPDAEAYLDELWREGSLTIFQRDRLRAYLDQPETDS